METARTTGCILLSLLASLLLALSFSAQASNTISIGVVADNEPYSSMGPLGPRGFSIDVLNELSQQTQIDFRYRMGSWPEIYSAFLRGDLDAIDEVSWRPERVGKMLFTEPYHLRQTVIVHNPANPLPPVKTVEDLQPFRLGVMRDIYYADAFQDAGIEVRHYDLLPDLVRALAFGWVDAIVGPEITLNYLARRDGFHQLRILSPAPLGEQASEDFRIAVQPDNRELQQRLDAGLKAIDPRWLEQLRERWQEYGGEALTAGGDLQLTAQQKAYLSQLPPLRVGLMDQYAPFSFLDNGKLQGMSVDYLSRIAELTGLQITPVADDWATLIELFKRGEIDLLANMSESSERRAFTRFSRPYHRIPVVVFSRNPAFRFQTRSDLSGKRIGYGEGIFYQDQVRSWKDVTSIAYRDQAAMFEALASGQLDLVIGALPLGNHLVRRLGLSNVQVAGELTLSGIENEDLRFGVRPELAPLPEIIDAALEAISVTERNTIADRWLGAQITFTQTALNLTPAEHRFLQSREHRFSFCSHPQRLPLESMEDGRYVGLGASLLSILERKLNLSFEHRATDSWQAAQQALASGQCDLLPVTITTGTEQHPTSVPYQQMPVVVLGRLQAPFIDSLSELGDQPIGVAADSGLQATLALHHPGLNLKTISSEEAALEQLQKGELYGYIGLLATTSRRLAQLGMADIRVIGRVPQDAQLSLAVTPGEEQLMAILDKAIEQLSPQERQRLANEWTHLSLEPPPDYTLLWQVALAAGTALLLLVLWNRKLGSLNRQLAEANDQLATLSQTDSLTGLHNRSWLSQHGESLLATARRHKLTLVMAMLDVDHFKRINDTYGHGIGDHCLASLGTQLRQHFRRDTDHLIRLGGEEFLYIATTEQPDEIRQRLDDLRRDLAETPIHIEGHTLTMTVSLGVVTRVPATQTRLESLFGLADQALYQAKREGRNRLVEAAPDN
ncbi:MAG: diguanylate cyclase [Oceanospirillaceae bacterium]|nr:diguanylate cyclase [Oceanospirillaceae bacterium]